MIYNNAIQTLAELTAVQAEQFPERRALICQGQTLICQGQPLTCQGQTLTYQQLHQRSQQLAQALLTVGIQPGARVAFLAQDCLQGYEILFACAQIGAVLVPVNWRLSPPEVRYILQDAEVELLFVGPKFYRPVASILPELTQIKTIVALAGESPAVPPDWLVYESWRSAATPAPVVKISSNQVVVQMYTSGTTGHPKGVQLVHDSFFAIARAFARTGQPWIGWRSQDISLIALPLFHIGGLWWAIRGLVAGAENVLLTSFVPAAALQAITTYGVTKTCLVPAMMQAMLAEPSSRTTNFDTLDTIVYGGSPIAETLLTQAINTFACDFVQIYGMTETGNCAVCLPASAHSLERPQLLKAAGKPFPGVSVTVLDAQQKPLPVGEIGEICLRSPANMVGYWKLPEATDKTLVDGWIHTGDAGYLDKDGYIFICDRIKDMICYASENVYPAEVENILYQHPAIADVAVIGVPDPQWGEAIKAMVVLKPDAAATHLDIINFARGKIANFKLPRTVDFIETLPRTPSGKVQKGKLRDPYWQGYERKVH
ncbi:MAG: long-chain-fatty-acid--CoA ligase [Leptolyngbyaceae cyanobacterium]